MIKPNYQTRMEEMLAGFQEKPRLLLHVCCAPCSSSVLERLAPSARVTAFFDNPNLDSQQEYDRRAQEEQRFARQSGLAQVVVMPYDPEAFLEAAAGLEDAPEGGERCRACFRLRLARAAQYAKEQGFDLFTTTLTVSPLKNAAMLNAIGQEMGEKYGVPFLPSDFKKKEGYKRSTELSKEYDLYRQDYCGCVFSKNERDKRVRAQLEKAAEGEQA